MEIFFSPEVITPEYQLLNVVNSDEKAVGNVAFLFHEKKLYVYGILEEEGVSESFKDLIYPYVKGLSKTKENMEVYASLYTGCKKIDLKNKEGGCPKSENPPKNR